MPLLPVLRPWALLFSYRRRPPPLSPSDPGKRDTFFHSSRRGNAPRPPHLRLAPPDHGQAHWGLSSPASPPKRVSRRAVTRGIRPWYRGPLPAVPVPRYYPWRRRIIYLLAFHQPEDGTKRWRLQLLRHSSFAGPRRLVNHFPVQVHSMGVDRPTGELQSSTPSGEKVAEVIGEVITIRRIKASSA